MKKISILFPFRGDGGWRDRIFEKVLDRYHALLPDAEICIGSSDADPFSRSGARNDAFRQSTGDILLINDADTFCTWGSLATALTLVDDGEESFVLPYDVYYNVNEWLTEHWLSVPYSVADLEHNLSEGGYDHRLLTAESGVLVVSREAWDSVGGYDENFIGYGWEDNAFVTALTRANGQGLKIPGSAFHLYHALDGDPFQHPHKEHNRALSQQYGRHSWRTSA